MSSEHERFRDALQALALALVPGATRIESLTRLSAGATLETWSFDVVGAGETVGMILRRAPGGLRAESTLPLSTEAEVIRAVAAAGVPAPEVRWVLTAADGLGDGFLMTRIPGETIPRKILRDAEFAEVRPRLAFQLGAIAGAVHGVDVSRLPPLATRDAPRTLDALERRHQAMGTPRPVFDLAIRWLRDRMPAPLERLQLIHGDYRNGNVIFGPEGVRAVLDWEIAHLGDPMEDLAYLCIPPWRFGELDRPAGGLGPREQLFEGYESVTGLKVDRERIRFWEVLSSLRWGVGCAGMVDWFQSGRDARVERAMIARRASENELDLLRAMTGRD
ncbi:MAG TPA: phosphotransferase family protein [Quisquiliibacterium sp.]|nr:phosphotransferase family protein [Quisquiliibacterium sp.]